MDRELCVWIFFFCCCFLFFVFVFGILFFWDLCLCVYSYFWWCFEFLVFMVMVRGGSWYLFGMLGVFLCWKVVIGCGCCICNEVLWGGFGCWLGCDWEVGVGVVVFRFNGGINFWGDVMFWCVVGVVLRGFMWSWYYLVWLFLVYYVGLRIR